MTPESKEKSAMESCFQIESWLYQEGKNKSTETKSAMMWGALWVAEKCGEIDWDSMRKLYGEFMSKTMNLR